MQPSDVICGRDAADLLSAVVEHGQTARLTARGGAMRPLMDEGDTITVRPLRGRRPRVGEVVVANASDGSVWRDAGQSLEPAEDAGRSLDPAADFSSPDLRSDSAGHLVVRRVVARRGLQYLLRGDDRGQADGWFPRLSIAGTVTEVERDGVVHAVGAGGAGTRSAWLVRTGRDGAVGPLLGASRAVARGGLHALQSARTYRRLARRRGATAEIAEAAPLEVWEAAVRFGLNVDYDAAGRPLRSELTGAPPVRGQTTMFVARRRAAVVGFVQYVVRPGDALWSGDWLYALEVWTPYRGMGIGRRLAEAVVERARKRGSGSLLLTVPRMDRPAVALYEALGFKPIEEGPLVEHLQASESPYERALVPMQLDLGAGPGPSTGDPGDAVDR